MTNSNRLIQILIILNIILISIVGFLVFGKQPDLTSFKQISAKRLNIIGENGTPILVIGSKELMGKAKINGKTYPHQMVGNRQTYSGIIFYSELGDEVGGLIYKTSKTDSSYYSGGSLTFDGFKQNQVLGLQHSENGSTKSTGIKIWDRPSNVTVDKKFDLYLEYVKNKHNKSIRDSLLAVSRAAKARGEDGVERLFLGSNNKEAQIQLKDQKGRVRAKLFVTANGEAKLQFYNEKGEVITEFPKE